MYEWIHDDITWCGNECSNTACERNLANRLSHNGMFSMALFRNTETCPLYRQHEVNKETVYYKESTNNDILTD